MKTKNGILAFIAIVLAVRTALTFAVPPAAPWVKVRYLGDPAGQFRCVRTTLSCYTGGVITCRVTVADINQDTKGYANSECDNAAVLIGHSSGEIFNPSETIIEAVRY